MDGDSADAPPHAPLPDGALPKCQPCTYGLKFADICALLARSLQLRVLLSRLVCCVRVREQKKGTLFVHFHPVECALGLMSFSSEVNVLLYQANLMQANALQRLNSVDAHHNLGTETAMV